MVLSKLTVFCLNLLTKQLSGLATAGHWGETAEKESLEQKTNGGLQVMSAKTHTRFLRSCRHHEDRPERDKKAEPVRQKQVLVCLSLTCLDRLAVNSLQDVGDKFCSEIIESPGTIVGDPSLSLNGNPEESWGLQLCCNSNPLQSC